MGESPFRCGRTPGRLAVLGLAFAGGVLLMQAAVAQSRSPAGDKGGAKSLAGTVVQFEEKPSRAVIYLEERGGLVTSVATPVERANAEVAAPPAAPKSAAKSAARSAEKSTEKSAEKAAGKASERAASGASPLRAAQSNPAAAPGAARP
jgi:hypothetical protein